MKRKHKISIIFILVLSLLLPYPTIFIKDAEASNYISDKELERLYSIEVLEDNDLVRVTKEYDIMYTYNKIKNTLTIDKNGNVEIFDLTALANEYIKNREFEQNNQTIRTRALADQSNSSMFSPWSYNIKNNRATLKIFDGKDKSKTVSVTHYNEARVELFTVYIDRIRQLEGDIIREIGLTALSAFITGGLGALAAITGSASVLGSANEMNKYFDKAKTTYYKL